MPGTVRERSGGEVALPAERPAEFPADHQLSFSVRTFTWEAEFQPLHKEISVNQDNIGGADGPKPVVDVPSAERPVGQHPVAPAGQHPTEWSAQPSAAAEARYPAAPAAQQRPPKKRWWTLPKILITAGLAVLLAGGGGGAIGYAMGQSDATHRFTQRLQNGRFNGNGQARRTPGPGQFTAPASPDNGSNP